MGALLRDLTIEYSSGGYLVRPIEHLDLDIDDGEVALLLGASGCGKTTLLSALAAILTPTSGSINVDGVEVTELGGKALVDYRRRTVGVVFQAFNLVPSLSALENVAAPLMAAGERRRAAFTRAARLLDQVELGDRASHRPGDLSGGGNSSASRSREPWPQTRLSSWPTSRPLTSTTSRSRGCCASSKSCADRVGSS